MEFQIPNNGSADSVPSGGAESLVPDVPWALFLDVDGTILKLAETPDGVALSDRVCQLLERTADALGGALALISGRSIANLDDLFSPLQLPCAGLHGLERRGADGTTHILAEAESLDHLRKPLRHLADSAEGLLLEDKGPALALHYRRAPGLADQMRDAVDRLAGSSSQDLRVIHGKMVSEVKPRRADKGSAIAAFMAEPPFAGGRPVFIGDDVTDEDGFRAVNRMGGLTIHVGDSADSLARFTLPDVDSVIGWLARICTELEAGKKRQNRD